MKWFKFFEFLDLLYHKSGNWLPLRWACDRYDNMLIDAGGSDYLDHSNDSPIVLDLVLDPYALRCPVCEGLDYPGLNHNTDSPYCNG